MLKDNLEILQGKFANQENEKIKETESMCIQRVEDFEQDIYNLKLKKEIQVVFDAQLKELNDKKQDNNIEFIEEKAYYLSQVLNSYQSKNIYNNWSINSLITSYSKDIVNLQDWALRARQKKIEEEKKKQEEERRRQNQINNTITTNTTDNTNTVNNTNITNNTNKTNNTNTVNNSNTTNTTNSNNKSNSSKNNSVNITF